MYTTFYLCLYPYDTVLPFHYIWVSHNHTKTLTLQFYLILVLTVPNRQVYSCVFEFFIFIANKFFVKKNCSLIIWFCYQIVLSFFCCYKFNVPMFSNIFHGYSKTASFITLKKFKIFWPRFMIKFNHFKYLLLILAHGLL